MLCTSTVIFGRPGPYLEMRRFRFARTLVVHAPGGVLAAWVAESHRARLLGLAALERLPSGRALLIPGCRAVHTWGMRFALDVAFLEWPPAGAAAVHGLEENVHCRRFLYLPGRPGRCTAVLEAPAGSLRSLGVGAGTALRLSSCGGRAAAGPPGAAF